MQSSAAVVYHRDLLEQLSPLQIVLSSDVTMMAVSYILRGYTLAGSMGNNRKSVPVQEYELIPAYNRTQSKQTI